MLFTRETPTSVVGAILKEIDRRWALRVDETGEGYRRIILVGHSIGGLLMRKVAVMAFGQHNDAPFEPGYKHFIDKRPWAERLERLVMLAGMAKGWTITSAATSVESAKWTAGTVFATLFGASERIVMGRARAIRTFAASNHGACALSRDCPPSCSCR